MDARVADPTGIVYRKYPDGRIVIVVGDKMFDPEYYEHYAYRLTRDSVFNDGQPVYLVVIVREKKSGEAVLRFGTRI